MDREELKRLAELAKIEKFEAAASPEAFLSLLTQLEAREAENESLRKQVEEERETWRMQIAGISAAAFGHWKSGDPIKHEYVTVALADTADLYTEFSALRSSRKDEIERAVRLTCEISSTGIFHQSLVQEILSQMEQPKNG